MRRVECRGERKQTERLHGLEVRDADGITLPICFILLMKAKHSVYMKLNGYQIHRSTALTIATRSTVSTQLVLLQRLRLIEFFQAPKYNCHSVSTNPKYPRDGRRHRAVTAFEPYITFKM